MAELDAPHILGVYGAVNDEERMGTKFTRERRNKNCLKAWVRVMYPNYPKLILRISGPN